MPPRKPSAAPVADVTEEEPPEPLAAPSPPVEAPPPPAVTNAMVHANDPFEGAIIGQARDMRP